MPSNIDVKLRRSPLHEEHVRLGAKMTEFGGFEMPLQYRGIREEHMAVRQFCGLFDASHMGEIEISGRHRKEFVNYLLTNDANRIGPGSAQYSLMCNNDGGVIDDLFVMDMGERYILVVNASNTATDLEHILKVGDSFRQSYAAGNASCSSDALSEGVDVRIADISDTLALLALQGPGAETVLGSVLGTSVSHIKYFSFEILKYGETDVIVSRTGYTGEDGFELYLEPGRAVELWRSLLECEVDGSTVTPCGLGARDSLRLEMGYSLYGHELSTEINPYEAGLGFTVRLDKAEFVGREALAGVKASGPARHTVGLKLVERGVPRTSDRVCVNGEDVGYVTSGGFSPVLGAGIALALVSAEAASVISEDKSTSLSVVQRGRRLSAQAAKTPFVAPRVKR